MQIQYIYITDYKENYQEFVEFQKSSLLSNTINYLKTDYELDLIILTHKNVNDCIDLTLKEFKSSIISLDRENINSTLYQDLSDSIFSNIKILDFDINKDKEQKNWNNFIAKRKIK